MSEPICPARDKLVYIAGHRTTYGAPFAHIDRLQPGDRITLEMPYGTFRYAVTGHEIVDDNDLSVLRSRGNEVVALQACHPRFFATERYIVWAKSVLVTLTDGSSYKPLVPGFSPPNPPGPSGPLTRCAIATLTWYGERVRTIEPCPTAAMKRAATCDRRPAPANPDAGQPIGEPEFRSWGWTPHAYLARFSPSRRARDGDLIWLATPMPRSSTT